MHDKEDMKKKEKEMMKRNGYHKEEPKSDEDSLDIKSDVDALMLTLTYRKSLNRKSRYNL